MVLFGCFCRQSLTGKKYKLRPCTWVMHHFSLHDGEGGFRSSYNFLTFVESEHCSYLANGKESCRAWSTQAFCKASQMPGSHKKYIVSSFTLLCFLMSLEIFEWERVQYWVSKHICMQSKDIKLSDADRNSTVDETGQIPASHMKLELWSLWKNFEIECWVAANLWPLQTRDDLFNHDLLILFTFTIPTNCSPWQSSAHRQGHC